ncbi:hypothetical protein KIW84_045325 [Lathyrus oleraceus]|uniref:CCHC-type domain-containing protein n=1 Tax=Pisum sativum TaxID=3888 RepID=A0A9D4XN01_PEA|nr:hypothetical protein KIW84_045325 [Pisum sativum]
MYYRCNERGHKSNVCPTRRVIDVAKVRDEEEEREGHVVVNDEYARVEFAEEEYEEMINFVLHKILLASKDEEHCGNLFKTQCSIKNKVCNPIVDNGGIKNLVSRKLVHYLKLSTKLHENSYIIYWVSMTSKFESWQFDNDNTYRRQDNVMMFTRGRRKIDMTPVLHFDTNSRGKKSSF